MRSGQELLRDFSDFIGDYHVGTATTNGAASGTTIVDTALRAHGDDTLIDRWFRISDPDSADVWEVQRATDFTESSGTVDFAPGYGNVVSSGIEYEMHRHNPARKFAALNGARVLSYPQVSKVIRDETVTGDGWNTKLLVPAIISKGPVNVYEESPTNPNPSYNLLNSQENKVLTNWTASGFSASIYSRTTWFPMVPKYDNEATKLTLAASTGGTYTQTVANMRNSVTASQVAGWTFTYAQWVYCDVPSRIRLEIVDNAGQTTSASHSGLGWQRLEVSRVISPTNSTTFSARVVGDSGAAALVIYLNRGWLAALPRIPQVWPKMLLKDNIFRADGSPAELTLNRIPQRGYQLRMVGRDYVSSLGRDADLQPSNSMEVSLGTQELLFAKAARLLFAEIGMVEGDMEGEFGKIREVEDRWAQMAPDAGVELPDSQWMEIF